MYTSVLQFFEETEKKYPGKFAYVDVNESFTFSELKEKAKRVGSCIARKTDKNNPVVVFMDKRAYNLIAYLGVVYAGCFYVPIDKDMPIERIEYIINTLDTNIILYDECTVELVNNIKDKDLICFNEILNTEIEENVLRDIRSKSKNTDLLYVLFTSGSTGKPKGVTISHGAVIDFVEWICNKYNLDENISLCNQAPFYFDASVPDLFIPLKVGATLYIPPKKYYTFPKKIMQYVEQNNINTLIWVPSALCNVVNCKAFDVCKPTCIKLVIFCGEEMPCKHLNVWIENLPNVLYVNMYGPTEATYACMFYEVRRRFENYEKLPLGKACENCEIILLNDNKPAKSQEIGEICILGQCLSYGYYNNLESTNAAFMQNPLNKKWNEYIYRTGDLAYINDDGEYMFVGRLDNQIKKLGHRIELAEIENVIQSLMDIDSVCCVFDENRNKIIALYVGEMEEKKLRVILGNKLQKYMIPDDIIRLKVMPMNINGKIDRKYIKEKYVEVQND